MNMEMKSNFGGYANERAAGKIYNEVPQTDVRSLNSDNSEKKPKDKLIRRFKTVAGKSKYVKIGSLIGLILSLVIVGLGFAAIFKSATMIGGGLVTLGLVAAISFVFGWIALKWYNEKIDRVLDPEIKDEPESADQSCERACLNMYMYLLKLIVIVFLILGIGCIAYQIDILNLIKAIAQSQTEWTKYFGGFTYDEIMANSKGVMYAVGVFSLLLPLLVIGILCFAFRMLGSYRSWQVVIQFVCIIFFQLGFIFLFLAVYGWKYREVANVDKSFPLWVPEALLTISVIAIALSILGFVSAYLENKKMIFIYGIISVCYTIVMIVLSCGGASFISKSKSLLQNDCHQLFDYIDQDYLIKYAGCQQKYLFVSSSLENVKCPKNRIVTVWEANLGKDAGQQVQAYGCLDNACCFYAYSTITQKMNYLVLVAFSLIVFGVVLSVGSFYMFVKLNKKKERGVQDKKAVRILGIFVLVVIIIMSVFIGITPDPPIPSPINYVEVVEMPRNNTLVNVATVVPIPQAQISNLIEQEQKNVLSSLVQMNTTVVAKSGAGNANVDPNITFIPTTFNVIPTYDILYTFNYSSYNGSFYGDYYDARIYFNQSFYNQQSSIQFFSTDTGFLSNYTKHLNFVPVCPLNVNTIRVRLTATLIEKKLRRLENIESPKDSTSPRILQVASSDGVINFDTSKLKAGEELTIVDKYQDFSVVKARKVQIIRGRVLKVADQLSINPLSNVQISITPSEFPTCPSFKTTSGSDGSFQVGDFYPLNSGVGTQYNLRIESAGSVTYQSKITIGGLGWSNTKELGDIKMMTAAIVQKATISSRVLNAINNTVLDGVTVSLYYGTKDVSSIASTNTVNSDSTATIFTSQVTSSDGSFAFPDLFPNKYTLIFVKENYYTEYRNLDVIGNLTAALDSIFLTPLVLEGQIRFVLSWPDAPKDLDLHSLFKVTPYTKCEVYFGQRICAQVSLDTQSLDYGVNGVETITINTMGNYVYAFAVHKYVDASINGRAEGDNPVSSYYDDSTINASGNSVVSNQHTNTTDLSLMSSGAKLSVYVAGFKAAIVQVSVPAKFKTEVDIDGNNYDPNKFTWWLALCLDGNQGVNSISVVNSVSMNMPDVTECEKIYKNN